MFLVINESELDITRMRAAIERKQTTVDQMNKKLDQLMATSGGEELGPLEVEIASLNKTIEQMDNEKLSINFEYCAMSYL